MSVRATQAASSGEPRWRVGTILRSRIAAWPEDRRPRDLFLVREWLTWQDGTVARLARVIHQERAFERLPILADALEEAGCSDEQLLDHLRQPRRHARGCWALDLLLGRR